MFVRGFLQWNSAQELVGGNFLFNYRYLPGSDLFLGVQSSIGYGRLAGTG